MLKSPRRLPQRYNRRVTSYTDRLVKSRNMRHRKYARERFFRTFQRFQRKLPALRKTVLRFGGLLGLGLVAMLVGLAFWSPILQLRDIRVGRTDPRIEEELVQSALRPLLGKHMLFLNTQDIAPLLTAALPRVDRSAVPDLLSVTVRKDYPSSLSVRIALDPLIARLAMREPAGQADTAPKTQTGEVITSDFLTSKGMYAPYLPSQVGSGTALPLFTIVDWGARPVPWTTLIEPDFLKTMQDAEKELKDQFSQPVSERQMFIRAREFHLKTPAHELWFDVRSPLAEQLERYRLFLRTVGAPMAKQYVDLRLADRVVYR